MVNPTAGGVPLTYVEKTSKYLSGSYTSQLQVIHSTLRTKTWIVGGDRLDLTMDVTVHSTIKPPHAMNKLYWLVCDDKDTNLFEGRFQGRTRGEALKFLKQSIGRKNLCGLVFTITEIPVPLIREIVTEILSDNHPSTPVSLPVAVNLPPPITAPAPIPDSLSDIKSSRKGKKINLGHGEAFWSEVRAYYEVCRSPKQTAEKFGVSFNSVKTRARREGWGK